VSSQIPTSEDAELRPAAQGAVLVVDDDASTRALVLQWLRRAGIRALEASTGEAAVEAVLADPDAIDAILLDAMMPGIDGFEVLMQLKANARSARIPILFLSASAGESDVVRGVKAGAIDYLPKPFSGPILVTKVEAVLERGRIERALNDKLRIAEDSAAHDVLTRLGNRRAFDQRLTELAANAVRYREPLALLMLDIDKFKSINDNLGHLGGDSALKHLADKLRGIVRGGDQAFRYGGEEFVLLLQKCDRVGAVNVYERLRETLRVAPMSFDDQTVFLSVSGGIATLDEGNAFLVANLVGRADEALYAAKRGGRDRVELEARPLTAGANRV
jgi:two-component system, cell cycle response regulator